ncbi:MAG TPA: hypothetical protein VHC22_28670 [Pirellulales bacterium]|nr:hypothetical protein [Pirellulales bacterium]
MHTYFLLISVGAIWLCGIVGACIWFAARRANQRRATPPKMEQARGEIARVTRQADGLEVAEEASLPDDALKAVLALAPESFRLRAAQGAASQGSAIRFSYQQQQWAAPCVDGRLPTADDFAPVECYELFGNGVSYYSDSPSATETVVVALGTDDEMIFMLARVMKEVSQRSSAPAGYLLECQFIRRVHENSRRWARALRSVSTT